MPPFPPLSDAELVARILAGDTALFELVMRRYNRLLFRLTRAILPDDDEARDAVQAAYIRAYYHLDQFRGPAGLQSWLARIAINEAAGRRRRAPAFVPHAEGFVDPPALESDEPERHTMRVELMNRVQHAIDALPDEFRAVFMLRGVEQLSVAETAAALDIKEATVKTRFHRARALLRASLGRWPDDAARDAFGFEGTRCDAIVVAVLTALAGPPH
ncbi:MAG TPA: RNA polymerase sigma factor [Gammaproteobacteria bacterium]